MAIKKVYCSDSNDQLPTLEIYKNADGELFVNLSEFDTHSTDLYTVLSEKDAKELITDLAYQFGLLIDDPEREYQRVWNE